MIIVPDLFTGFINGREKAIDANWKDLMNYRKIKAQDATIEAADLRNQLMRDTYGGQLQQFDAGTQRSLNSTEDSTMGTLLNLQEFPGKASMAQANSAIQQGVAGTMEAKAPEIVGAKGNEIDATNAITNANAGAALTYAPQIADATARNNLGNLNLGITTSNAGMEMIPIQKQMGQLALEQSQRTNSRESAMNGDYLGAMQAQLNATRAGELAKQKYYEANGYNQNPGVRTGEQPGANVAAGASVLGFGAPAQTPPKLQVGAVFDIGGKANFPAGSTLRIDSDTIGTVTLPDGTTQQIQLPQQ